MACKYTTKLAQQLSEQKFHFLLTEITSVHYAMTVGLPIYLLTVCLGLGSTNNLSLCWGLHGGTRSLMVKKAFISYVHCT